MLWLDNRERERAPPHRLGRVLVRVLSTEVLQRLLEVAAVHAVAVDLQDDLARLETRRRRLPACSGPEVRGHREAPAQCDAML